MGRNLQTLPGDALKQGGRYLVARESRECETHSEASSSWVPESINDVGLPESVVCVPLSHVQQRCPAATPASVGKPSGRVPGHMQPGREGHNMVHWLRRTWSSWSGKAAPSLFRVPSCSRTHTCTQSWRESSTTQPAGLIFTTPFCSAARKGLLRVEEQTRSRT